MIHPNVITGAKCRAANVRYVTAEGNHNHIRKFWMSEYCFPVLKAVGIGELQLGSKVCIVFCVGIGQGNDAEIFWMAQSVFAVAPPPKPGTDQDGLGAAFFAEYF